MSKFTTLIGVMTLVLSASSALADPHLDAGGKCKDGNRWVKQELCVKHEPPHCKKGKACGNSCIPMDKVCHKPA